MMNSTRVDPLVATSMLTSTGGYWVAGVEAVRPSTSSMLAPGGGARSTKFPAASVRVVGEREGLAQGHRHARPRLGHAICGEHASGHGGRGRGEHVERQQNGAHCRL